jgi:hypothetical protein
MSFGASLFNLHFHGGYDILELGQTNAMNNLVQNPSIRGLTSENGNHCFARLDGGDSDVFIRGIYAEANNTLGSSILCIPSEDGAGSGFGVNGLFISDSNFEGFTRGIAIPAYQLTFKNAVFDNLFIDNVANGPAFEVFLPPAAPGRISDIRVSNSTLVSSSTACVIHGGARAVKLINDSCIGGQNAALPTISPCATPSAAPRGYALVQVTGTAPTAPATETVSVTVAGTSATFVPSSGESAVDVASDLGSTIASSSLSGTPSPGNPCPPLVPLQSYIDVPSSTATPVIHYSIGPDIELYSYQALANSPTIAVSPMTGSGIKLSLPNSIPTGSSPATFSPGDGIYVGIPSGSSTPYDITGVGVDSSYAEHGAGLHLQGGSAMTFTGNNLGGIPQTNSLYGVFVELGATYSAVLVQNNDLAVPSPVGSYYPVFYNGTPTAFSANSLNLSDNVGYNPVGPPTAPTSTPAPTCGSAVANPYPFSVQVYVTGGFTDVKKNGTLIYGTQTAGSVIVYLGGGETLQVDCSTAPAITWFGT